MPTLRTVRRGHSVITQQCEMIIEAAFVSVDGQGIPDRARKAHTQHHLVNPHRGIRHAQFVDASGVPIL
jgi:hypothetical protein